MMPENEITSVDTSSNEVLTIMRTVYAQFNSLLAGILQVATQTCGLQGLPPPPTIILLIHSYAGSCAYQSCHYNLSA